MIMRSEEPGDWILHAGDGNVIIFRSSSDCGVSDILCSESSPCHKQHRLQVVSITAMNIFNYVTHPVFSFFLGRPGGFFPTSCSFFSQYLGIRPILGFRRPIFAVTYHHDKIYSVPTNTCIAFYHNL